MSTKNSRQQARRSQPHDLSTMVYGKVPPQSIEYETAILGAIMLEKGALDIVSETLKPECFYKDSHQRIYKAMIGLAKKNQPIDILTVTQELIRLEELELVGGPYYITKLTNAVVSSANIDSHAKVVVEKYMQRELIHIGGELVTDAYEDSTDVFDLLDKVEGKLYSIVLNNLKKDFTPISTSLVKAVQRIEQLRQIDEAVTGVPSGFPSLDRITFGWQNTDLIILAARPSVGKTAFALNLARNAALHPTKPTPVAIFSLEMGENQLTQRMISAESEIYLEKIARGKLEEHEMMQLYQKGIQKLAQAPIFIDDTAGLNVFELRAKCRRLKNKHDLGLIIVDYLQLMTGDSNDSKNREREISKISRELKKLAKDLEVPLIALSQLSREVEKRGKGQKVPQLSDLRESGAIEQDADLVMFIYRPPEDEVKEDADLKNKGMVKIAKNRNGKLDEIFLKFYGEVQKWMELEDGDRFEMSRRGFTPVANLYPNKPSSVGTIDDDLPF